eukprot:403340581
MEKPNSQRLKDLYSGEDGNGYVMITGSSDGIGKVVALDTARSGFNLILVSRSQNKLEDVAQQCKEINPNIDVQTIPIDFSTAQPDQYKHIFTDQIQGKRVQVLMNVAGLNDQVKLFEVPPQHIQDMIKINIFSQVFMTKYMREHVKQHKQKSAFVHFSSILSQMPLPFHAVYSGTKRFNQVFGDCVAVSSNHWSKMRRQKQIDQLIVQPSGVTTNMTQYHEDPMFVKPGQVSYGLLRDLGIKTQSNGAFWHQLQGDGTKYLPRPVINLVYKFFGNLEKAPYK